MEEGREEGRLERARKEEVSLIRVGSNSVATGISVLKISHDPLD